MKKPLAMALAATMAFSIVMTGCSSQSSSESGGSSSSSKDYDIEILNGKPEIKAQMEDLAAAYEEETGIKVKATTIGGNQTASDELNKRYSADNMPDIFVCEEADFATWTENPDAGLVDLSGEQWTEDTDLEYVSDDYGTIGFPYTVEAVGLGYNKDILDKAGVDPSTLTSYDAFKEAFETIDSQKDDLGLTAVVDYAAKASEISWSTGTHSFGQYLDCGLAADDTTNIDLLNDGGQLDHDRFVKYGEFMALIQDYSDNDMMLNNTSAQQYAAFAGGEFAFVTQGSWLGAEMTSTYADDYEAAGSFECGFVPYAFDDGCDTIIGGCPSYWAVYEKGNVDEAKKFLQWCSEDTAQQMFVEDMGFVSPYNDCAYKPSGDPFAPAVAQWIMDGKISSWHTMQKAKGLEKKTGVIYENYAKGEYADAEEFYEKMQEACTNYYSE